MRYELRRARCLAYGRQRVAVPAKLIAGGDGQVAHWNGPIGVIVLVRKVENAPSYGRPVEKKVPADAVAIVTGAAAVSMQRPLIAAWPAPGPAPASEQPSPSISAKCA